MSLNTSASCFFREGVDHIYDLQVRGKNIYDNLQTLNRTVNKSLGSRINNALNDQDFKIGEKIRRIEYKENK